MTWCRQRALALLVAATALNSAVAAGETLDAGLREEVHRVSVPATDATIVVTTFRPRGEGPFPWVVVSHGTATTLEANRAIGRNRNLGLAREWVRRGYAVVVPVRRGYGASGGERLGDAYGGCNRPDFRRAGDGAALDLLAAVDWAKGQPGFDPKRWLFAGQSAGGFASIHAASRQPPGLTAVLAFSMGPAATPIPARASPARRKSSHGSWRRSRRGSRCRCCGSTRRTTSTSARACRNCGSTRSARRAGVANSP